MKFITVILFSVIAFSSVAQNEIREATLYLKDGAEVTGTIKGSIFNKQKIRVYDDNGSATISVSKMDSLITDSIRYVVKPRGMNKYLSAERVTGGLEIVQSNKNLLTIKRFDTPYFNFTRTQYRRVYSMFCLNYIDTSKVKISTDEFFRLIEECNTRGYYKKKVVYDSLKLGLERFIVRLSVYRPHVGFELRLLKNVTLFNSIGVNFFGDYFREATTVVNYDYIGQLRWFYLYNHRLKKGKSNYKHSGQYIAASYHYFIDVNTYNPNVFSLQHGWQDNNLFNKTSSSIAIGLGIDPITTGIYIVADCRLGIAF